MQTHQFGYVLGVKVCVWHLILESVTVTQRYIWLGALVAVVLLCIPLWGDGNRIGSESNILLLKFHYDYKTKNQRYMYIWPKIGEAEDLIVNLCRDLLVTYTALGDMCSYLWLMQTLIGDLCGSLLVTCIEIYKDLYRLAHDLWKDLLLTCVVTCCWLV